MKLQMRFVIILFALPFAAMGQTWVGSINDNWNTSGNWSPATVPGSSSSVTINEVIVGNHTPKLNASITVNQITFAAGSQIDFNGYNFTVSNKLDANGNATKSVTFNNSATGTDIGITINGSTNASYWGNLVVNGNTNLTLNSSNMFYEGYSYACHYNGNFNLLQNGVGAIHTSYSQASQIVGNYTVARTAAGTSTLLGNGASIDGDFSYNNLAGGATSIGHAILPTTIGGTVNVNYDATTPDQFQMLKVKNTIPGGDIAINNINANTKFESDTLIVNTMQITNYTGGSSSFTFYNNKVGGNVNISDAAVNSQSKYYDNNTINGNLNITNNGSGVLYEGYSNKDVISGSFNLTLNGTGTIYTSHSQASQVGGDYTVTRTAVGTSVLLSNGASIGGNFSYTNLAGGATSIGHAILPTTIGGTVNINYDATTPAQFQMQKVKNATVGGDIAINNINANTKFDSDTLLVNTMQITNYTGGSSSFTFYKNNVDGNVNISDAAVNSQSKYYDNNTINGNLTITNNGSGVLFEGYNNKDVILGSFNLALNSIGIVYTSYSEASQIEGDYTITRTAVGASALLSNGASIGGNFSYTNLAGGATSIGHAILPTTIGGTVNINYDATTPAQFQMQKVKNATVGGDIAINNINANTKFESDTLIVNTMQITNYTGGSSSFTFYKNNVDGNVNISDAASNQQFMYSDENTIHGDFNFVKNGTGVAYMSYLKSDWFLGNATFANNGSSQIILNHSQPSLFHKNLSLNGTGNINFTALSFVGNQNGVYADNRATPTELGTLNLTKTVGTSLTLATPLSITTRVHFNGGDLITSSNAVLTFNDNATHLGASNDSKVIGPVSKIGNDIFTFPLGNSTLYIPLGISAPSIITDKFTANFMDIDPTSNGYDTALRVPALPVINGYSYFDVARDAGNSDVVVTLGYNFASGYVNDQLALRVAHWNGTQWEDLGNGAVDGNVLVGSVSTLLPVNSFSPFTIAANSFSGAPLPVDLEYFEASIKGQNVLLQWKVNQEENLKNYEVELSVDGNYFETIFTITAQNAKVYDALDTKPNAGKGFYRLKMMDNNGKIEYSKVALVEFKNKTNVTLSPNPAQNTIQIHNLKNAAFYQIFDLSGKIVLQGKLKASNSIEINALLSGQHILYLNSNGTIEKFVFIKL